MKKSTIGHIAVVLGMLLFALELYGLEFIYHMGLTSPLAPRHQSALEYLQEAPVTLAVILTMGVIVYGVTLIIIEKKRRSNR